MSEQEENGGQESAEVAVEEPQATGKPSSGVAWLALLLVLALAGGAGWQWNQLRLDKAALENRVAVLERSAGAEQDALAGLSGELRGEMTAGIGALEAQLAGESERLGESLDTLEKQMAEQRAELSAFSAADRDSWLLAEAEYLLRLANQRLIMAGDTVAAQALLAGADSVLREVDDPGLHGARRAVAADLAAVRAVPGVDVEGIYLRLAALAGQATQLVIFTLPEQEDHAPPPPAEDWQERLRQGYEDALIKLSDYIIIRRRDVPMQAMMDPQWEGLVRQNLRMLLEQAQVALLSGNQVLYTESLERARHWVAQFMDSDEAAAVAMDREIQQLAELNVEASVPDLSRSLRTLDEAIEQRVQQGGAG